MTLPHAMAVWWTKVSRDIGLAAIAALMQFTVR